MCEHSAGYDYSTPQTVALATGQQIVASPYHTAAEFSVIALSFGGAGGLAIGVDGNPPTSSGTFVTSTDGTPFRGIAVQAAAAGVVPVAPNWMPAPNARLYLNASVTGGSAIIVIQWRRLVEEPQEVELVIVDPGEADVYHELRARQEHPDEEHGTHAYLARTLFGQRPKEH